MTLLQMALAIVEHKYPGTTITEIKHKYDTIYVFRTKDKAGRVNVNKNTCTMADIHHLENIT